MDTAQKVELDRLNVVEEYLAGVRPLAQLVIEYQRYFIHLHAQRLSLEMVWPCCNVKSDRFWKGCQRVEYPFIETDKDFNDTSKWFHPGQLETPFGWSCCNSTRVDEIGCEYNACFDPTQFEHPGRFGWFTWICCDRNRTTNNIYKLE